MCVCVCVCVYVCVCVCVHVCASVFILFLLLLAGFPHLCGVCPIPGAHVRCAIRILVAKSAGDCQLLHPSDNAAVQISSSHKWRAEHSRE